MIREREILNEYPPGCLFLEESRDQGWTGDERYREISFFPSRSLLSLKRV